MVSSGRRACCSAKAGAACVATDHVGNRELTLATAQATTQVRAPTVITWATAADGDWDTPSNRDLNRIPTATDDVVINSAGITVTHDFARADAIHSLTTQALISLSTGSLSIAAASIINAAFTIDGGTLFLMNATLNDSGTLVNQGTLAALGTSAINVPFTTGMWMLNYARVGPSGTVLLCRPRLSQGPTSADDQ